MTNRKTTKRALFSSVVALLLCFTMLLGTTFAWFTDSATSGSNVITSGNLDIEVTYTLDGEKWANLDGATDLFQVDLWEPGHTEVVVLKIENKGSLALKYAANMNIVSETIGKTKDDKDIKLSDILKVSTLTIEDAGVDPYLGWDIAAMTLEKAFESENGIGWGDPVAFNAGNVLELDQSLYAGKTQYVFVKVDMPETVGNEANHDGVNIPKINFGINVLATQYTYEKDSFGDQYDSNAQYPDAPVIIPGDAVEIKDFPELKTALTAGGDYIIANDITVDENLTVSADTALYATGETLNFAGNTKITVEADKSLEIYGLELDAAGEYSFDADGAIQYDADARRTTPLLNTGAGSTLVLGQGTVIENVVAKGAAVVSIKGTDDNRAKLVLDGATIQNCAGESGTIINVDHAGDVVIEAGTVISNNASYNNNNHGIIRVYNAYDAENPSTVTMNGGEISGNYYSGNGLIGLYYGKFIMNGGKIVNNSWFEDNQKHNGFYPIVYVHSNSQMVMNGGEITGNSVRYGVLNCLNSAKEPAITINDGIVKNNINTDTNKDAFAAVVIEDEGTLYKSLSVSSSADISGTVWDYFTGYYTLEDYMAKITPTTPDETPVESTYYLIGSLTDWETGKVMNLNADGSATLTLELAEDTYEFKIYDSESNTLYGNDGTVVDTCRGWTFKDAGNCTLNATGGTYTFKLYTSDGKLKLDITKAAQ